MVDLKTTHEYGAGPFPDIPEEIFIEIGCRLLLLQQLELLLAYVAKVVFEQDSDKRRDAILQSDNKTMGQLLNTLRAKVEIKDDFNETLKRTLEARNIFIHEFSHIFNLQTKEGIGKAIQFLAKSMDDLEEVTYLLRAAVTVFSKELGVCDENFESNWRKYGDLDQLENIHIPKVDKTFSKRRK